MVRYSPQPKDLIELIKLIPNEQKQKIESTCDRTEESKGKVKHRMLKEKWVAVEVYWNVKTSTILSISAK